MTLFNYEWSNYALTSAGAADAYRPVLLDSAGTLDNSLLPDSITFSGIITAQKYKAIANTTLADDATSTLTTAGLGLIYACNTADGHHFLGFFSSGGVVEISDNGSSWANSDSDGSNCLYWSSGLVLKNRVGSEKNYIYHIFGSTGIV